MAKDFIRKGIIEPEELHALIGEVKIIDSTFVMPGSAENPQENWQQNRIGNAIFFDIDGIADHTTDLPHMLPTPQEFESAVSALGISNDDLIVVYGQSGIVMGPARVWWTFRTFGHDNICVLNGGLPTWSAAGYELNTAAPETPDSGTFKASFRPELVRHIDDVKKATEDQSAQIFDARPGPRFHGQVPEPRESLRSGHMKGAQSIPCGDLVDAGTGKLKSAEDLQAILDGAGYQQDQNTITTCGSGVTACMIALALFHQGNRGAAVYDGSWSEWGMESPDTEVVI